MTVADAALPTPLVGDTVSHEGMPVTDHVVLDVTDIVSDKAPPFGDHDEDESVNVGVGGRVATTVKLPVLVPDPLTCR